METGDERTEGDGGFGSEIQHVSTDVPSSGSDERGDREGSTQRRPRRSRAPSVKLRENQEAVIEAKAAAESRSKPRPKPSVNLLHSTVAPADEVSEIFHPLSMDDDVGSDADEVAEDEEPSDVDTEADSGDGGSGSKQCNFKRSDRQAAEANCDFESHDSINHWFPKYKSKGQINCPFALIRPLYTQKGKAKIIREWRTLTYEQQSARVSELRLQMNSNQETSNNNNRRRSVIADNSDEDDDEPQTQQPQKKRRTLADDRAVFVDAFGEEEEAWLRVIQSEEMRLDMEERRNAANRERTQQKKTIYGVLDGGLTAAETSAAAAAMMPAKRRSIEQPPATIRQLNDQVVNRAILSAEKACMKVAKVTQPEPGVDLGGAFTTTILFTVSNVPRAGINGGGAAVKSLRERPIIKMINPGGDEIEEILFSALLKRRESRFRNGNILPPVIVDEDDILFFSNGSQLKESNDNEMSNRKKAGVKSTTEIEQSLSDLIISYD